MAIGRFNPVVIDIIGKYLLPGHEVVKCTLLDHAVCISKLLKLFEYRNCISKSLTKPISSGQYYAAHKVIVDVFILVRHKKLLVKWFNMEIIKMQNR